MFGSANMMVSCVLEMTFTNPIGAANEPYVTNPISDDKKKNGAVKYFSHALHVNRRDGAPARPRHPPSPLQFRGGCIAGLA